MSDSTMAGLKYVVVNEILMVGKPVKVFRDLSGFYVPGKGRLRHMIVVSVGHELKWSAYEGWGYVDMDLTFLKEAISANGDKMFEDTARATVKEHNPALSKELEKLGYRR